MNIDFDEINRLTRLYRGSLNQLNENDQSIYNVIFKDKDYIFDNLYLYRMRTNRVVRASSIVEQIKHLQALMYSNHKLLNDIEKSSEIKASNFNSNLSNFKKELKRINDSHISNFLKIKEGYNKVVRRSVFNEDDFSLKTTMYDYKKRKSFLSSYACEIQKGCIDSALRQVQFLKPKRAILLNRTASDAGRLDIEEVGDPDYTFREDKKFKCIIPKKVTQRNNAQVNFLEASIEVVFLFNKFEEFNQINIDLGSRLPILLEKDDLEYFDGTVYRKANIYFSNELFNKKEYFFEKFSTNKIKVKLTQRKSLSNILVEGENSFEVLLNNINSNHQNLPQQENIKIFDLSIDHIEFLYKSYKQYSFYREKEDFLCKGLKNFSLRVDEIETYEDNFIEKECVLKIHKPDLTYEEHIVPIAGSNKIKEYLCIKHKKGLLTFPYKRDSEESVKVMKSGVLVNPNFYTVETLGESDFSDEIYSSEIVFKSNFSYEADDVFIVEYETLRKIKYNKNISLSQNSIDIDSGYQNKDYIFSIKPRFIFRNLNKNNISNIIKSYSILAVAEEEVVEKNFTFKKVSTKIREVSSND